VLVQLKKKLDRTVQYLFKMIHPCIGDCLHWCLCSCSVGDKTDKTFLGFLPDLLWRKRQRRPIKEVVRGALMAGK